MPELKGINTESDPILHFSNVWYGMIWYGRLGFNVPLDTV